jgi:hypothetical protein
MKICLFENCGNPVFSHGFCTYHQNKRTDEKYLKKKQPKTYVKQTTGEGILFQTILNTRPHVDFITGEPILNANFYNCHHILTKKSYEKFRLFDKNVILLTDENHYAIHSIALSDLIEVDSRWQKYIDLQQTLKELYYKM